MDNVTMVAVSHRIEGEPPVELQVDFHRAVDNLALTLMKRDGVAITLVDGRIVVHGPDAEELGSWVIPTPDRTAWDAVHCPDCQHGWSKHSKVGCMLDDKGDEAWSGSMRACPCNEPIPAGMKEDWRAEPPMAPGELVELHGK